MASFVTILRLSTDHAACMPINIADMSSELYYLLYESYTKYKKQEAQLSQRDRAAACLNFGKI